MGPITELSGTPHVKGLSSEKVYCDMLGSVRYEQNQ